MTYDMTELNRETRMGGLGTETTDREVRRIDLSDFENRRSEIAEELWSAATDIGFFQIVNHGIDLDQVREPSRRPSDSLHCPPRSKRSIRSRRVSTPAGRA